MVEQGVVNRYYLLPRWLIFSVRMMNFISTRATLRVLEYLFYKPLRFKPPDREARFIKKSKKTVFQSKGLGVSLGVYRLENDGERVLLVHGWNGRASQFHGIAQACHHAGLDVTAIDLPGHGRSDDRPTALPEFVKAISEISTQHGPFDHIIGHSIGGIAVLNCPRHGLEFEKIVTISIPAIEVATLFQNFIEMFGLPIEKYADLMIERASKRFDAQPGSFDPIIVSEGLTSKVMIVHCNDDVDAEANESVLLSKAIEGSELVLTSGLGHRRILRDEGVIRQIVDFLKT